MKRFKGMNFITQAIVIYLTLTMCSGGLLYIPAFSSGSLDSRPHQTGIETLFFPTASSDPLDSGRDGSETPFSQDADYNVTFNAGSNDHCAVALHGWTESYVTGWDGTQAAYFNESSQGTDDLYISPQTTGGDDITEAKGVYLEFQDVFNYTNSRADYFWIRMANVDGSIYFYLYPSDTGVGECQVQDGANQKNFDLGLNRTYINLDHHRVFVHFDNATGKITFGYDDHVFNWMQPARTFATTSVDIMFFQYGHPGVIVDNIKVLKDQVFPLNDYMKEYYSEFKLAYPPNNYDFAYSPIIHADKMTYNKTKVIFPFFNQYGISVSQTYYYNNATDGTEGIGVATTLRNYAIENANTHGIYSHSMNLGSYTTSQIASMLSTWNMLVGSFPKIWVDEGSNQQNFDRNGSNLSSNYYIGGLRNASSIKYGWVFYLDPERSIPVPPGYDEAWRNSLKNFHIGNNGLTYSTAGQNNLFSSGGNVFAIDYPGEPMYQEWDYYIWWIANERGLALEHTYDHNFIYKNIGGIKYTGLNPLPSGYTAWNPAWDPHYLDATNPWMIMPEVERAMINLSRNFSIYSNLGDKLIDRGVIYNGSSVSNSGDTYTLTTPSNLENATIYARTNESGKALSWGNNHSVFTKGFYGYSWGATIPSNDGSHDYTLSNWNYYVGDTEQIGRLVFKSDGNVDVHFKKSGSLTVQIPSGKRPTVINNITGGDTVSFSFSNGNVTFTGKQGYQYLINFTCILTVNTVGSGSVVLDPTGGLYTNGTVVTLTAVPAAGWSFDHWNGDASGSSTTVTVTMTGNRTVTATFVLLPGYHTLTINIQGQGAVTKDPDKPAYTEGQLVNLTATPATGWSFDHWSGDLTGDTNPSTITIDANKIITAIFTINQYTLTVDTVGSGSVDLNPIGGLYDYGTVVTLTATPATDWSFDHWSGDLISYTNPSTITIDANKIVTAIFQTSIPFSDDADYNVTFNAGMNDHCAILLNGWTESYVTGWDGTLAAYFNESSKGTGDLRILPKTIAGSDITDAKGVYLEFQDRFNYTNSYADDIQIRMISDSGNIIFYLHPGANGVGYCVISDGTNNKFFDLGLNQTYINLTHHRVFIHFNNATGRITFGYDDHVFNWTRPARAFTTILVDIMFFKSGHPGVIADNIKVLKDQVFPLNDYMKEYYSSFKLAYPPNNYDFAYSPVMLCDQMTYNMTKPIFQFFNSHGISVSQTYWYSGYSHSTPIDTEYLADNATLRNQAIGNASINGIYTYALKLSTLTTAQMTTILAGWKSLIGSYPLLWVDCGDLQQDLMRNGSNPSSTYYMGGLRNGSSLKYGWLNYQSSLRRLSPPASYDPVWRNSLTAFYYGNNGLTYSNGGQNNLFTSGTRVLNIETSTVKWDYYIWWLANERALSLERTFDQLYLYKNIDGTKYTKLLPTPSGYSAWNSAWGLHYRDDTSPWTLMPEYATVMTNWTKNFSVYSTLGDKLIDRGIVYNGSSVMKSDGTYTLVTPSKLENATIYTRINESGKALSWGNNYSVFTKGFYGYSWGATIPSNDGSHDYTLSNWNYYVGDTEQIGRLVFKSNGDVDVHFKKSGSLTVQIPSGKRPSVIYNITGGSTVSFSFSNGNVTFTGKQEYQYLLHYIYTLNVNTIGSGSVTLNPTGGSYTYGTVVTLTATSATGWSLDHWSGDLTGNTNPTSITIDANKTVTATFTRNGPYTLTLTKNGTGTGTIEANSSNPFYYGDIVTIWANASSGSTFTGFTGNLIGTTTPQTLTMDATKNVNAEFTLNVSYLSSISLISHWNLISIPCYESLATTDITVYYNDANHTWTQAVTDDIILNSIYSWDRTEQKYTEVTTLEPGKGYWMWAYQDCELRFYTHVVPTTYITDLKFSWNIMGLPYEDPLDQNNVKINYSGTNYTWDQAVDDHIILGFFYRWDSITQTYTRETTFTPGDGYWMYAYYDCKLYKNV